MSCISQAIIMCGGKGTRIIGLTKDLIPKCLIKFNKITFLELLIQKINILGIKKIIFCTGHLSNQIEKFLDDFKIDNKEMDLNFIVSKETIPLGTAGALKLCSNKLEGDNSIVLNGDTFVNNNLEKYKDWHFNNNYEISIMLSFVLNASKYGSVKLLNSKIENFKEKKNNFFKYVYNGIFITKNEYLDNIELKFSNVEDTFFQNNIENLYGYKSLSKFYDIGTIKGYKRAKKFLDL